MPAALPAPPEEPGAGSGRSGRMQLVFTMSSALAAIGLATMGQSLAEDRYEFRFAFGAACT